MSNVSGKGLQQTTPLTEMKKQTKKPDFAGIWQCNVLAHLSPKVKKLDRKRT